MTPISKASEPLLHSLADRCRKRNIDRPHKPISNPGKHIDIARYIVPRSAAGCESLSSQLHILATQLKNVEQANLSVQRAIRAGGAIECGPLH